MSHSIHETSLKLCWLSLGLNLLFWLGGWVAGWIKVEIRLYSTQPQFELKLSWVEAELGKKLNPLPDINVSIQTPSWSEHVLLKQVKTQLWRGSGFWTKRVQIKKWVHRAVIHFCQTIQIQGEKTIHNIIGSLSI